MKNYFPIFGSALFSSAFSGSVLLLAVLLVICAGCSQNAKVTGEVKFSDGSPLTVGTVVLSDGAHQYRGELNQKGQFAVSSIHPGDGLPAGKYRAWIANANTIAYPDDDEKMAKPIETVRVNKKFTSGETSGLSFDVKGSQKISITVEKP